MSESFVLSIRDFIIDEGLKRGKNVIVDDTNFNPIHETKVREIASRYKDVDIEVKFIDISPEKAVVRDLSRHNSVGSKVIWEMYNKYLRPPVEYVNNPRLPNVIIVDIDGTLAIKGNRSPFDWENVGLDSLNSPVLDVVLNYMAKGGKLIIFSGRDSICRQKTVDWVLSKANLKEGEDYSIFMREEGDCRKDSIVKRELFDEHVAGKYHVDFVLDDRNSVVDMWRLDLGLPCFQVNYGDF